MKKRICSLVLAAVMAVCIAGGCMAEAAAALDYQDVPILIMGFFDGKTASDVYESDQYRAILTVSAFLDLTAGEVGNSIPELRDNAAKLVVNSSYVGKKGDVLFVGGWYEGKNVLITYDFASKELKYCLTRADGDEVTALKSLMDSAFGEAYIENEQSNILAVVQTMSEAISGDD